VRTRLAAALVLLLHLFAPAAGDGSFAGARNHPSVQALEAGLTHVVQAAGHPQEERASRGQPLAVAAAGSGGLAVLPGAAVPVMGSRRAAVAAVLPQPCPRPDRGAAPARAPPASTR
ncbi:hypothetical protein JYK22_23870, partial [Nonomuraea sp. RK-328]|nr:hypothetical protein [Nonomuraea sp. RK-328]